MLRALALVLIVTATPAAAASQPYAATSEPYAVRIEHAYVTASDGAPLHVKVFRPDAPGRFPVILVESPYGPGRGRDRSPLGVWDEIVPRGYVLLAMDVRGTGCSAGNFEVLAPRQAQDGHEVIEWAAVQPWSTGNIGMTGFSYPGMMTILVAATRPPHLRAAAAYAFHGDGYRDVMYPGGIYDWFLPAFWGPAYQPALSFLGTADGLDAQCVSNLRSREFLLQNVTTQTVAHPFDDAYWDHYDLVAAAERIDVPFQMNLAFQDQHVGSRGVALWDALPTTTKRLVLTNGTHAFNWPRPIYDGTAAWFDHWLRGAPDDSPPVTVYLENAQRVANHVETYGSWPPNPMTPLYLRGDGTLSASAPASPEPAGVYVHPSGAQSFSAPLGYEFGDPVPNAQTWAVAPAGGLTYTSAPMSANTIAAGPWELELYVSSTASDADVYATIAEVSPVGDVTYVSMGILRASHRMLDASLSRPGWPHHPHTYADPMTAGTAYRLDLETQPLGHLFRAGSRIRIDISAPPAATLLDSAYLPAADAGAVSVLHAPGAASVLRLPLGAATGPVAAAPACGSLTGQPCRAAVG